VDVKSLHAALDAARGEKGLSWRQLAKDIGVSASTISRMANGLKPDVTAFAAMTTWLRMPAERFYVTAAPERDEEEPELLASLVPLLRERYRVIRYDLRGFGRSSRAAQPFTRVGDLRALLDHCGVGDAVVVGHSGGGGTALELALLHLAGAGLSSSSHPEFTITRGRPMTRTSVSVMR